MHNTARISPSSTLMSWQVIPIRNIIMKATNLAIWSLVALLAAGFTACEKDDIEIAEPHMTLTMNEGVGSIKLDIYAKSEDQNDVWIDLNNNGIQENGEKVILFHISLKFCILKFLNYLKSAFAVSLKKFL